MHSIAARVAALNEQITAQAPAEVLATFADDQARLNAEGVPNQAARPGTSLPDVPLLDAHGTRTSLYEVTGGKPAVVVFYRGEWCPFCTIALRTYQEELLPELTSRGITLVAVSPQRADGSLTMKEKNELTYPVVTDNGNVLAALLGILATPTAEVREAQAKLGLDVAAANADSTANLPMPTVTVVDSDHTVRWIDVHPDYTTRSEVADIIGALDTLR